MTSDGRRSETAEPATWRLRDWRLRHKVLAVTALPVVVAVVLSSAAFFTGLERVWRDAVPEQALLQRLDTLSREYQGEVREFVLERRPETIEEVAEIEEEFEAALERLGSGRGSSRLVAQLEPKVHDLVALGRRLVALDPSDLNLSPREGEMAEQLEEFEELELDLEVSVDLLRRDSERRVDEAFRRFTWLMLAASALALSVAVAVALALARWFERPIGVLQEASERLLDGDFSARERVQSRDELGELAEGFDRGAREIRRLLADEQAHLETLRRNQAQLVQSGKMAAVGELAAGVAHEINNPLSAVLTYGVLLREKAEKAPPETLAHVPKLVERLRLIETAGRRCRDIADRLLAFSRQDESEREPVDLGRVVDDALELTAALQRRRGMAVESQLENDLPPVLGHANQLCQVLVNLIGNSLHAVPEDGKIVISARRRAGRCELTVEDNGPGIAPQVQDRLFEPFVTTKPAGEGTGLGLSIVYSIVQAHQGEIRCESEPGRTIFTVELPLAGA